MRKISLILILVLIISLMSGCIEQQATVTPEKPDYVISDSYVSRDTDRKIEYVYIAVQNFDDKDILVTVDFQFALLDLNKLGSDPYGGGRTPSGGSIWDDSYRIQRTVIIQAHDIEKIYYTPELRYDNKLEIEWDYDISASFN